MASGQHLIRPRGKDGFAFRIRVPADLIRKQYIPTGKAERRPFIIEGLGTSDAAKAKQLAAERLIYWTREFERARSGELLTLGEIADAARNTYDAELRHLEAQSDPVGELLPGGEEAWLEKLRAHYAAMLAIEEYATVAKEIAAITGAKGVRLEPGHALYNVLARALLRAKITAHEDRLAVIRDQRPPEREAKSFLAADAIDRSTMRELPMVRPKVRARVEHGPEALFVAWVRERKPAADTEATWRRVFLNLQDKFGAREITAADAQGWTDALIGPERSAQTVRKTWLNAAKTVYGWAARQNPPRAANSFAAVVITMPRRVETRESRALTADEWRTILRAASKIEPRKAWDAARHWIPWLLAYSGARAGEITQLRGQDVREEASIPYIHITPEAGTVKTRKPRSVPLHPHLIEMGFLEFVRSRGPGPLFFDAKRKGSSDRRRAVKLREHLAAWVRSVGVDDPNVSPLHGFRHTFKSRAARAKIESTVRDAICGHAPRAVADAYETPTLEDMAEALATFPRFL